MIVVAAIIVVISLWQRNFLFAFFTVAAGGTLIAWSNRQPNDIDFELNDEGLKIGHTMHHREKFNQFSIQTAEGQWGRLLLKKKHKISFDLAVPIPSSQIDNIRQHCLNLWTETEYKESLADELANWLKF